MVNITLVEVHFEDGTFSANLPFGGASDTDTVADEKDEEETTAEDTDSSRGKKGLALLGVLVFLVVATAAVKYLTGGDEEEEPDVAIDTGNETPTISTE